MSEFVDRWLYRRGFTHAESRQLLRMQIELAGVSSAAALAFSLGGAWGWSFAAGAVLATVNFWWLARFARNLLSGGQGMVGMALFWFFLRLGAAAVALYGLIVLAEASVWALLAGLTTVLATILWWGARVASGPKRPKEA